MTKEEFDDLKPGQGVVCPRGYGRVVDKNDDVCKRVRVCCYVDNIVYEYDVCNVQFTPEYRMLRSLCIKFGISTG